ncbi:MAG: hypothetical protein RMI34_07130 [Chloroherpetonaceae bacterium]|nr:hypothetical protein [Chloroherpetonaceae bacterium]MCS7211535.1 hypothetical protein [Chloroherpetonaceae bacterium]MDW8019831.1 hypothetical protein [Chloroherpetonaceae bacterium]MDW8465102.1 hypothetical protein [Chloroherpetonaceae bacterium]
MTSKEHLRHYLPDFIAGKTPHHISEELQQLLASDAEFRKEYEALRVVWLKVQAYSQSKLAESQKTIPPFYFETFADKVAARLRARQQPLWLRLSAWLKDFFLTERRYELAGALTGVAIGLLLVLSIWRLDQQVARLPVPSASSTQTDATVALTTTIQYAAYYSPEALLISLSEEDASYLIEAIEYDFADDTEFKTLSKQEVEALLKIL